MLTYCVSQRCGKLQDPCNRFREECSIFDLHNHFLWQGLLCYGGVPWYHDHLCFLGNGKLCSRKNLCSHAELWHLGHLCYDGEFIFAAFFVAATATGRFTLIFLMVLRRGWVAFAMTTLALKKIGCLNLFLMLNVVILVRLGVLGRPFGRLRLSFAAACSVASSSSFCFFYDSFFCCFSAFFCGAEEEARYVVSNRSISLCHWTLLSWWLWLSLAHFDVVNSN